MNQYQFIEQALQQANQKLADRERITATVEGILKNAAAYLTVAKDYLQSGDFETVSTLIAMSETARKFAEALAANPTDERLLKMAAPWISQEVQP